MSAPSSIAKPVLLALVGGLAVALVVAVATGWWRAYAAAAGSAVVATGLTLPLLIGSLRLPPAVAGPRVIAIGFGRAVITLAVALGLAALVDAPRRPALGLAMGLYALLLAVETWAAARRMVPAAPTAAPSDSTPVDR